MELLIVDDNPNFRHLLKRFLEGDGLDFYECENGAQAVAAYRKHRPDRVLMDIEMSEMDGLTATQLILADDPAAYIVIVTQHDETHWREAAVMAGARAFVAKEDLFALRAAIGVD